MFYSFQYTNLAHILVNLFLIISCFVCYFKWYFKNFIFSRSLLVHRNTFDFCILTLPFTLAKFIYETPQDFPYTCLCCLNKDNFSSFLLIFRAFIYFSCLSELVRTSSKTLNRNGKSRHPVLSSGGESIQSPTVKCDVRCRSFLHALYHNEDTWLAKSFSYEHVLNFS